MVAPSKIFNSDNCIQSTRLVGYSTTVCTYKDCNDSIFQFIPCALRKNVSEATSVARFLWLQQSCNFLACFARLVLSWNQVDHEESQAGQRSWAVLGITKGQPILCYRKGSATPSSAQKIGTWSTICHNYPAVGIAPPYLILRRCTCIAADCHSCYDLQTVAVLYMRVMLAHELELSVTKQQVGKLFSVMYTSLRVR